MKNSSTSFLLSFLGAVLLGLTGMQGKAEEIEGSSVLNKDMTNPGYLEHPDWFMQSFLDIDEDIVEAAGKGRHLALYFYQDGCSYCRKLIEENFGDEEIVVYTRQHFEVVAINIYGSREVTLENEIFTEKVISKELQVNFTPTMIFFDVDGREMFRMNGYYQKQKFFAMLRYLAEGQVKKGKFLDYYSGDGSVENPTDKAKRVTGTLSPPFSFSKTTFSRDSRPLLVIFDRQDCESCQELHQDILVRSETMLLLKDFQLAVVDVDGEQPLVTPHGVEMSPAAWARYLGIKSAPSIVFFDNDFREVLRIESDLKAYHVQSMLEYVATRAYQNKGGVQSFLRKRTEGLEAKGQYIDIMN